MGYSRLEITNGTTTVNLINANGVKGFKLKTWAPIISGMKNGGVWRNSSLADGRSLVMRNWANVTETMTLDISGWSQNDVIARCRQLRMLLEQARDYWIPRSTVGAVWIVAQSDCEDYARYAYLYNGETPEDNNPYGVNFTNTEPFFEGWTFAFERGHWMDVAPGSSTCVQISAQSSGYTYGADLVLNGSFETAGGGGADVFANWTEVAGGGTISQDAVTVYHLTKSCKLTSSAYVQQNIAVVAGSTYVFSVKYINNSVIVPQAAGSLTLLNITAGGTTILSATMPQTPSGSAWYPYSVLVTIPAGCASLGIRLIGGVDPAYFDEASLKLTTTKTFGQEATCNRGVTLPNHTSMAQITDVYRYDASVPSYSANLISAALPFNIWPDPAGAGDALYVGIDDCALYSGPFGSVIFDVIPIAATGESWQYWNGAWTNFPAPFSDSTNGFSVAGVGKIVFNPPSDWARTTVNGIYGFWVRFYKAGAAVITPVPQQQNRAIYTPIRAYASIDGDQIPGDITSPILSRTICEAGDGLYTANITDLVQAVRTDARGADFTPFINLSDVHVPSGFTLTPSSNTNFYYRITAPTGRALRFNIAAAGNGLFSAVLSSPLVRNYKGAFRLLMRCEDANPTSLTAKITLDSGGVTIRSGIFLSTAVANTVGVFDFGKFTLPAVDLAVGEEIVSVRMDFILTTTNAGGTTAYIYDLIFIPIDENLVEIWKDISFVNISDIVAIDSIFPKVQVRGVQQNITSAEITRTLGVIGASQAQLKPATDQRLLLISPGNFGSEPQLRAVFSPIVSRVARYFSMRGSS